MLVLMYRDFSQKTDIEKTLEEQQSRRPDLHEKILTMFSEILTTI